MIFQDFVLDSMRKHARGTSANYARYLELFKAWIGPDALADDLSFAVLSDYHAHLSGPTGRHGRSRRPNYVLKHFSAIELAWAWAWKRQARGDYHGVPQPDSLELKRLPGHHKRAPTWAQMDAMIAAAQGWSRDLYVVLRCTGLRVQQVMGLRWDDFRQDGDNLVLHIRPELGKSHQEKRGRWIPVAPVLAAEIAGWGRREGWLIESPRKFVDGTPNREAKREIASRTWARAEVPADLWTAHPHHAFRAGFISSLKRAGADDEAVEFLVGHSRGIRESYAAPDALPLVETVAMVPSIDLGARVGKLTVVKGGE